MNVPAAVALLKSMALLKHLPLAIVQDQLGMEKVCIFNLMTAL